MFTFIPIVIPQYSTRLYACEGFSCYLYFLLDLVMLFVFLSFFISIMKK